MATTRTASAAVGASATIPAVGIPVAIGWGDLLAHQLPDSALVPVTVVLARQAVTQGAAMGGVRIGSKAIPVIG